MNWTGGLLRVWLVASLVAGAYFVFPVFQTRDIGGDGSPPFACLPGTVLLTSRTLFRTVPNPEFRIEKPTNRVPTIDEMLAPKPQMNPFEIVAAQMAKEHRSKRYIDEPAGSVPMFSCTSWWQLGNALLQAGLFSIALIALWFVARWVTLGFRK